MDKFLLMFLAGVLALHPFAAKGASRTVQAVNIMESPVLDGRLDEADWQRGEWQSGFSPAPAGGSAPAGGIRFKVLNHARGLWFGIQVADDKVVSRKRRHDGEIWHDDGIEITLAPVAEFPQDPNVREIAHFIVNADASRYEEYLVGGLGDSHWNASWQAAARRISGGYTMEIFIPFTAFAGKIMSADTWRLNVFRNDYGGPKMLFSGWNPAKSPRDSDHYGILRGVVCDAARFSATLTEVQFRRAVQNGTTRTVLDTRFNAAPAQEYDVAAAVYDPGKKFVALEHARVRSGADGVLSAALPFDFMRSGRCRTRLTLADDKGKVFDREMAVIAQLAPMTLEIRHPAYRNTLFATDPCRQVETSLVICLPDHVREKSSLAINLYDSAGKKYISRRIASPAARQQCEFDVSRLPPGMVKIEFLLTGACQAKLTHAVRIAAAPRAGNEVYIGKDGNLRVNGKPFFIRGFMGAGRQFDDMERAGCNTVHFYVLNQKSIPEILTRLDECVRHGLHAVFYPYYRCDIGFWGIRKPGSKSPATKFNAAEIRRIREMVNTVKDHPAFLGWYLCDEPRGAEWHEELHRIYRLLCDLDPCHPVFGCDNAVDSCLGIQNVCDILMLDMYLCPMLKGAPLRSVATILAAVKRVARGLTPGKMLVYVPQAYDEDDYAAAGAPRQYRPPTAAECRAVVLGALAAGAKGILPYKIGNPAAVKNPPARHVNAGVYADPELQKVFLDELMPYLKKHESFFLSLPRLSSSNGIWSLTGKMPDGTQKTMAIDEKPPYPVQGYADH